MTLGFHHAGISVRHRQTLTGDMGFSTMPRSYRPI